MLVPNFIKKKIVYCYAPFNNLLIDQQGQFRICCHNNTYTLGKYPENTPEEIWFGAQRKAITQQFLKGEIPPSCSPCFRFGLNSNSPDSKITHAAKNKNTAFKNYPLQIEFLLDNNCNLNCVMCATNISSSSTTPYVSTEAPVEFSDTFIELITPFLTHGRYFVFSGGEPFLIPQYFTIWEIISKLNPSAGIYVQTNGTILNDTIKDALKKYKIQIGVSVDSIIPETYEKIRKNAVFNKTFENLEYFIRHTESIKNTLTLMTVPMTLNAHEIPQIIEYCNAKHIYFALSILERPIHLALWTWPSQKLKALLEAYNSFTFKEYPHDRIIQKNISSFNYYKELIKKYMDIKTGNESREKDLKKAITEKAFLIKDNLLSIVQEKLTMITPDKNLSQVLTSRFFQLITKMEKKYAGDFNDGYPIHAIFIIKDIALVLQLMTERNDSEIEKTASANIEEFCLLMQTRSYDRILNENNSRI